MKKIITVLSVITMTFFISTSAFAKDVIIKNKLFSVTVPEKFKGLYTSKTNANGIFIYDKASKKAGFGGFAFGIQAYKNPAEHAMCPGCRKIGELTDDKDNLYDIVLLQPTDVQYDYTKGKSPDSYNSLYDLGEKADINGVKASKYYPNQGMKGKDLYNEVLQKHIKAVKEKWDSTKLEDENMSYMYKVLSSSKKNVLSHIGYAYYDVNGDGIEELFIGEIASDSWKGVVYDIYTMQDRKPVHVVSGGSRNRYFVCDDSFICNEYSSGAAESGVNVYNLVENSTELFPQVGFKYDGYKNKKNPWFISYDIDNDKWENVTAKVYKERKSIFERYLRFDYTPLKSLDK